MKIFIFLSAILQTASDAIERILSREKSHKQSLSKLFPLHPKQNNPIRFLFVEGRLQRDISRTLCISQGIQYAKGSLICDNSRISVGTVINHNPRPQGLIEPNCYHPVGM